MTSPAIKTNTCPVQLRLHHQMTEQQVETKGRGAKPKKMWRKNNADKKNERQGGNDGSASRDLGAGDEAMGGYSRQGLITKMTKMQFLSHATGGKRSPSTSVSGNSSGDPAFDPGSLSDTAPENETQLDRKRRLNRNNERKKRAKRVVKIETLTAQFHTLTGENEELKTETKTLKRDIELVKQYMKEKDMKPDAARAQGSARESANLFAPLSAAASMAMLPSASDAGTSSVATRPAPACLSPAQGLSLMSKEQKLRLLQEEFEKQEKIITQLRLQANTMEAVRGLHPINGVPLAARAAASPSLPSLFAVTAAPAVNATHSSLESILSQHSQHEILLALQAIQRQQR